jgi:hypothetical protein
MTKLIVLILFISFLSCTIQSEKYSPTKNLSAKELDANLWSMIRYLGRAPEGLTPPERFYPGYDSHYVAQMKLFIVEAWYSKNDVSYFMVSRRAASLVDKRVATGGIIKFDEQGGIQEYEEVFRTWKMIPDTLKKRSLLLFDKMVKGESLKPYETQFSNGIEYIEFPDDRTYFDKAERDWKIKPSL